MSRILTEIWIYPIKSLGGIRVGKAVATEKGFRGDRRWMLVDEQNRFITQREAPQLALTRLSIQEEGFRIYIGDSHLDIPLETSIGEELMAQVWDDDVVVMEWMKEASEWMSVQLGFTCKLVHFPESKSRRIDPNYVTEELNVSLADGYPYLVIGESSLADLNQRLAVPVPMTRFRPNLVFSGGTPFEEDSWQDFMVGSLRFKGVKTCGRCVVTTNDNGRLGKEPLTTLSKYRKVGDKVCFGMNLISLSEGGVKEGAEIVVETFAKAAGFIVE